MTRVGDYELLHFARFLLPAGEEALLEFPVDDDTANFRIRFIDGDHVIPDSKQGVQAQPDPNAEDQGLITFHNWSRSGRDSTGAPMLVLTINEKEIFFMAVVDGFSDTRALDLQFMGKSNGDD